MTPEALVAYQTILAKWPQSLGAHLGLANIEYAKENYKKAAELLSKAHKLHPESAAVKHNLDIVLNTLNRTKKPSN